MVIDCRRTDSAQLADQFIQVEKGRDFELIWALRYLLHGGETTDVQHALGADRLRSLAERLRTCRSGVVYFGLGIAQARSGHATVEALLRLVGDLNAHTRFYARRMRIPGDVTGADNVLCWQTGFPFAVNLARGYPRYNPDEYSANEVLERREADVCLLVGSEGVAQLGKSAAAYLEEIPTIVLDNPTVRSSFIPTVQFTTAIYGIHETGTAYRMDEVPIPLQAVLPPRFPTDQIVLTQISAKFATLPK